MHAYAKIVCCLHKTCNILADAITVYAGNASRTKN